MVFTDLEHKLGGWSQGPQRSLHIAGALAHPGSWESLVSGMQHLFQNNPEGLGPAGTGTLETRPTRTWDVF